MAKLGPEYAAIVDLLMEVDSVVDDFKKKLRLPIRTLKANPPKPSSTKRTIVMKNKQHVNVKTSEEEWLGAAACRNFDPRCERRTSSSSRSPSTASFLACGNPSQVSRSNSSSCDHNLIASRLASIEQFENETRQKLKSCASVCRDENDYISFVSAPYPEPRRSHSLIAECLTENISPSLLALEGTRLFREKTVQDNSVLLNFNDGRNSYKEQHVTEVNKNTKTVDELHEAFEELLQEWLSEDLIERCIKQELLE